MGTEQFLDYFFPFKKLNLRKRGVEYTWEVEGDTDAFDADEKKLMSQGVAAFGGIASTYRIALLDKPTIVWDFHSLLIGL